MNKPARRIVLLLALVGAAALSAAPDISQFGGWRAWLAPLLGTASSPRRW